VVPSGQTAGVGDFSTLGAQHTSMNLPNGIPSLPSLKPIGQVRPFLGSQAPSPVVVHTGVHSSGHGFSQIVSSCSVPLWGT
jgi:hypothetical protein